VNCLLAACLNMLRRSFFKNASLLSAGTWLKPSWTDTLSLPEPEYLQQPLCNFHTKVKHPVIVRRIELLKKEGWEPAKAWFVRIVTDDLAYTIPANSRIQFLRGIFNGLVAPFFIGKDLRDIENLVEACYRDERNYKYCGMPLWNCIGHIEHAALGVLGTLAGESVAAMFGTVLRKEVPVYYTTFDRLSVPEVYVENAVTQAKLHQVNALKIKVGGRMGADSNPGRTQAIIPLFRKALGDQFTLYADANGSYENIREIINIGERLHSEGYEIWEEPCPFRYYELTRQATKKLKIKIAGGEQDTSLPIWERMIREKVVDVVQPDMMYPGGFIRALRIGQLAAKAGLGIAPHSPRVSLNQAPMLHLAAITPNLSGYQEWQPNDHLAAYYSPNLKAVNGIMALPLGPGWGMELDPEFVQTLVVVEGW
jgi:D-galactarolactone cycloisomerase